MKKIFLVFMLVGGSALLVNFVEAASDDWGVVVFSGDNNSVSVAAAGEEGAWTSVQLADGTQAQTVSRGQQNLWAANGASRQVETSETIVYWTGEGEVEAITGGSVQQQVVGWQAQSEQLAQVVSEASGADQKSRSGAKLVQGSAGEKIYDEQSVSSEAGVSSSEPGKAEVVLNAGLNLLFGLLGAIL